MSMRLCSVPLLVCLGFAASLAPAAGVNVRVELDDGMAREGRLVEVGAANLQLADAQGGVQSLAVERVRSVGRIDSLAAARGRVGLTLTDGTTLTGDEFSWSGDAAVLEGSMGRVELPLSRVRAVAWRAEGEAAAKPWLDAVPDGTTSDLVVIGKPEGFEFVECAISAIGPDTVTVVLDDETIPVKRSKVAGLRWLRNDVAAPFGGTVVDIVGGRLRADTVAWTAAGLLLDAAAADRRMLVPAEALLRIDYAAGRTTLLADVAPEKLDVEPFFGTLVRIDELATWFSPRPVAADARHAKPGLVVRPRTVAVWRVPPGARRFRTALSHGAGAGPALVVITVDDRQAFEQVIADDESVPVVLDVTGARRLGVTVDFGPAGAMAGAVRFEEPAIEQ